MFNIDTGVVVGKQGFFFGGGGVYQSLHWKINGMLVIAKPVAMFVGFSKACSKSMPLDPIKTFKKVRRRLFFKLIVLENGYTIRTFIPISKVLDSQRLNTFGVISLSISSKLPFFIVCSKPSSNIFLLVLRSLVSDISYKETFFIFYAGALAIFRLKIRTFGRADKVLELVERCLL